MNDHQLSRLAKLPEVGSKGLEALRRKTVMVVGLGGLGCTSATWLARSGVGRLLLVDPKSVDEPDLARQILYEPEHLGRSKAQVAQARLGPFCEALALPLAIDSRNLVPLAAQVDLILDGTDQLAPREALNQWALSTRRPVIFAGAVGWHGMVFPALPSGPCWHCVFGESEAAATCDGAGVWGPLVSLVASTQASLALQLLLGHRIRSTLLTFDLWNGTNRELRISRKPTCESCSQKNFQLPLDNSF